MLGTRVVLNAHLRTEGTSMTTSTVFPHVRARGVLRVVAGLFLFGISTAAAQAASASGASAMRSALKRPPVGAAPAGVSPA